MENQQPIAKIGTQLKLSGHDATIKCFCPDGVVCKLDSELVVFVSFEQIEEALAKENKDNES